MFNLKKQIVMDNKFVLSSSFNEIVFEKRNKKYGAYQIRTTYKRYALIAVGAAVLFFTCGSITWAYCLQQEDHDRYRIIQIDNGNDIPPIADPATPKDPEPPKEQEQQKETSVADQGPTAPDITSKIDIVDDGDITPPGNLEAGKDPNGVQGGIGSGLVVEGGCLDCPKADTTSSKPVPVEWTAFPPTNDDLDAYLMNNIHYPSICREQGIEGIVYMEFIVDTKGNYRDVKVMKGAHPALNAEALRVMQKMPAWTPAKDDQGRLVEFIMRKPIRFMLSK